MPRAWSLELQSSGPDHVQKKALGWLMDQIMFCLSGTITEREPDQPRLTHRPNPTRANKLKWFSNPPAVQPGIAVRRARSLRVVFLKKKSVLRCRDDPRAFGIPSRHKLGPLHPTARLKRRGLTPTFRPRRSTALAGKGYMKSVFQGTRALRTFRYRA